MAAAAQPAVTLYTSWSARLTDDAAAKLDADAAQHWDRFYARNRDRFFKDRHYLFREFPLLAQPSINILEVRNAVAKPLCILTNAAGR